MSKEIYISSTPHETRLAIVENDDLTEIYYERENEYTLAGSIYNGKVTRVLPGMQSSFVDIGLERDAFLYITDFMEEAGDSADFDSSDHRSGSRPASRDDRNGSREDRPRELNAAPREDSGDAVASSDRSAAPGSEPRSDRESRGDREGGRRRRGGRDSNRGNRTSGRDRQPEAQSALPPEEIIEAPPAVRSGFIEPGADASSELGEGAPGADGSRRWRGRRGRRRGRSSSQREESQALQGTPSAPGSEAISPAFGYPADASSTDQFEEDLNQEYTDSFDLDASAAVPQAAAPTPSGAVEAAPSIDEDRRPRDRNDRDRGGRGDRGDRNRGDRGGRDREARAPRAPRGFAPSRSLYGVDAAEPDTTPTDGPVPEPLILPGESLSKYRKGDDAQSASATSAPAITPTSRPSTEFSLSGSWDGGNVLPGETIRPRSNAGAPERSASESYGEGRSGSRDRNDRDSRRGRDDRSGGRPDRNRNDRNDRNDRSDRNDRNDRASVQAVPTVPFRNQAAAEPAYNAPEPPTPHVPVEEHQSQPFAAPVEHHEPAEYEPTEASASVRFDPTSRSEFRQSAPVAEPVDSQPEQPAQTYEEHSLPTLHASHEDEPSTVAPVEVHSIAHTITPQPGATVEPVESSSAAEAEAVQTHEFTSINTTGEMLSDPPPAPQSAEIAEPASPLHHVTAILESASDPSVSTESPSGSFEEEEMVEEEDFNATTLHASSIEEMDYEEEETLEGAADLGVMIREMNIDQITRPGDEPDEEDEVLEEEDTVHDHFADETEADDDELDETEEVGHSHPAPSEGSHPFASASEDQGSRFAGSDAPANGHDTSRDPDRRSGRRDGGSRDGRRGDRGRDRGGDRARSTGGSGDRSSSRPGRRDGRHSAQATNLPAISDLLKPGQEVLVQIAKEPIAKKGARITSHIALPGRFLVFMPTVNHTGVSRKIESDGERRRLKEILLSEKGEASGGFIVRTAASGASEEELRSDLRFLLNLWTDIKQRSESSKSPALIYHDLNLVERILRDQVTDNFSAIWVDTETEYERVLRFLQRFQPSLIRRVKLYTKEVPLFEQFGITEEINKALRSKVWLKSGGSIVINQTEALVAIDINTGKYVGKTARLEDTIVKTNLDAIPEIVRQIRLRDLGGIIIIDFIDMEERKNRHRVMAALEDELKKDRAPSKVLQFNDFGLVAITRKRVKQSLERTLSTTCNICVGTGMVKSPVTVCNDIYIEMRKMQKHLDRGDVMLRVNPEVVKQLKSPGTRWLQEMEEMVGKTILVKSDPSLHPEQFDIH